MTGRIRYNAPLFKGVGYLMTSLTPSNGDINFDAKKWVLKVLVLINFFWSSICPQHAVRPKQRMILYFLGCQSIWRQRNYLSKLSDSSAVALNKNCEVFFAQANVTTLSLHSTLLFIPHCRLPVKWTFPG